MRDWNYRRVFRCLICLILVCCFLVNASPIRAKASVAAVAAWVYVNKEVIAACALAALGILAGSNPDAFQSVARDCANFLETSTSWVYNGTIAVLGLGSATMSTAYLPGGLLQTIWEWIFNTGTVTTSGNYASYYTSRSCSSYSEALAYASQCPSAYIGYSSDGLTKYIIVTGESATYISFVDGILTINGVGINHSVYRGGDRFEIRSSNTSYWYYNCTKIATSPLLLTAYDLTLGLIEYAFDGTSPKKLEETETYKEYSGNIIEFPPPDYSDFSPDVKSIPYFPVGIPSTTIDGVTWQDQQGAQSGNHNLNFDFNTSTDPDPGTDTDPDVDPDPGADPDPNPDPDPGTDSESGSSSWTPSGPMGNFTLDLKNYFPFCIPFDLYAFFTCLNADPVAPVIDWIIPMPGGGSYPFQIDLSVFDSVAQTLRRLQLLLFCVGLAFKTRDLIKG